MDHYIQSASHDFKLFEMNDIAKYGIMTMTSKVLSPLQYISATSSDTSMKQSDV